MDHHCHFSFVVYIVIDRLDFEVGFTLCVFQGVSFSYRDDINSLSIPDLNTLSSLTDYSYRETRYVPRQIRSEKVTQSPIGWDNIRGYLGMGSR